MSRIVAATKFIIVVITKNDLLSFYITSNKNIPNIIIN